MYLNLDLLYNTYDFLYPIDIFMPENLDIFDIPIFITYNRKKNKIYYFKDWICGVDPKFKIEKNILIHENKIYYKLDKRFKFNFGDYLSDF